MASLIGKALAKRTLKDAAQKNINSSNPFEEEVPVYDRNGQPTGKTKTRKRGFPTGLTPNDTSILKKVRRRAYRLDMSLFNCCGIRFGWSAVIGIIPVIGDFIDAFLALMLVKSCQKVDGGLPATLRARMIFNIALDFGLGLIPLLGDVADAVFRANTRNAWLLEMYLTKKSEAERIGHVSDPELGKLNVPSHPGTKPPAYHTDGNQQGVIMPNQPEPARTHARTEPVRVQPGSRNGFPISTNGKIRRPDGEMAMAALDYGVRAMRSQSNLSGTTAGGGRDGSRSRSQTPSGRSTPRTREDLAKAALQYGAQAALGAYSNGRSKSAGRA
jgi:hypothetical protein